MSDIQVVRGDGSRTPLAEAVIESFRASLRGPLLKDGDGAYEGAREIWNAMITRRPALIARCAGVSDVLSAVRFARDNKLLISVRGGGHNIAGNALCEGGLLIDLSQMRSVRVDPRSQRAWAEPGCTLGDFDHETQAFGLATPVGINSTTGIAGLTLGGGFGWISRKHGLTIDNLVSAEVVTSAGELVHCDSSENSDLFWAIRGGGGNFGIVTSFEFKLHPVGPEVLCGLLVFPFDKAKETLQRFAAYGAEMPDELACWAVLRKAPPLPFLPESVHGKEIVAVASCYCGDPEKGREAIKPVYKFGTPIGEHIGMAPFAMWQKTLDPLLTPGARNYWKSHNFTKISDGYIDVLVEYAGKLPSPHCEIALAQLGGAVNRVPSDATAYAHRDPTYVMNVHGRWETPAEDEAGIGWARGLFDAAKPFASAGAYINFMTEEEVPRVKSAFGGNYDRLVAIKKKYDPGNMFRLNQNIAP